MVKKNIIFIEKDTISVIRHKGNKIEFIKKDGEVDFEVFEGFWEWWKNAVSYLADDEVDLCFIYYKDYELLHDDFLDIAKNTAPDESIWDINYIKNFFWELKPTYFRVCLVSPSGAETLLGGNKAKEISQKRFYTNMEFVGSNKSITEESSQTKEGEEIKESDISSIAKFFTDLLRKERGYD